MALNDLHCLNEQFLCCRNSFNYAMLKEMIDELKLLLKSHLFL